MSRLVVRLLLAAALVAGAACKGEGAPAPRPEVGVYSGPEPTGGGHPFGLKWDWSQIDTLSPYLVANSGGTTFYEFAWCEIETQTGERDWTTVDRAVESARRLGYRINLKIRVGSCWATGNSNPPRNQHRAASSLPRDLFRYSNFVAEAVTRYSKRGVGDFAFENEVNARNFWRGSAKAYQRVVETAADAAHAASPDIRVFDAGLNSPAWGVLVAKDMFDRGERKDALAFYRRYFAHRTGATGGVYEPANTEAELKRVLDSEPVQRAVEFFGATRHLVRANKVDGLQLHYYDPWQEVPLVIGFLRDEIGEKTPIEAWEAGIAWPEEDYVVEERAPDVVALMAMLLSEGVRRAVYLPVSFSPGRVRLDVVVRPLVNYQDGVANAAGEAYASLVDAARGADKWHPVDGDGVAGLVFGHGSTSTLVVWSKNGEPVTTADGFKVRHPGVFHSPRNIESVVARP